MKSLSKGASYELSLTGGDHKQQPPGGGCSPGMGYSSSPGARPPPGGSAVSAGDAAGCRCWSPRSFL